MNDISAREITAEEIRAFEEDGVVHLRGAFSADWIEELRDRAAYVMANPGKMSHELARDKTEGRFFTETFLWHRDDVFRRFVHEPRPRDSPAKSCARPE